MPLKVSDGIGAWIDDFKKSDAPQFKGKSEKERRDQAIAAYLSAKRGDQNENSDAVKAFLAKGGKITKLPPGKAQGYHGKDDPGKDVKGVMAKPDTDRFSTRKKVRSMESAGHYMYKDGKKVLVKSKDDHDKYAKMGYSMNEISSNKLSDYMRKSAADAAKPGASARRQDKRIGGQSMADKKIRKKMGYSSTAKVAAGPNQGVKEAKQTHVFDNEKDARAKAKQIGGKYVKGTGKSAGKHAAIKEAAPKPLNRSDHTHTVDIAGEGRYKVKAKSMDHAKKLAFKKAGISKLHGHPTMEPKTRIMGESVNEETNFEVNIEGLPMMFMSGMGPGEIKQKLRKIVKQPSMIQSVKRVTDATVRKTFRLKAQGRDEEENEE